MKQFAAICTLFSVLSLSGCSGNLSRAAAKELTQTAFDNARKKHPYRLFTEGGAQVITGLIRGDKQKGPGVDFYPGESHETYSAFAKVGLVTVTPLRDDMYTVALTDLGRQLFPEQSETECRYTAQAGTVCLPLSMSKSTDGPVLKQVTNSGNLAKWQGFDLSSIKQDELHATAVLTTYWKLTPLALKLQGQAGDDGSDIREDWNTFLSKHQSDYSHIEQPMTFDKIDGRWTVNPEAIDEF